MARERDDAASGRAPGTGTTWCVESPWCTESSVLGRVLEQLQTSDLDAFATPIEV